MKIATIEESEALALRGSWRFWRPFHHLSLNPCNCTEEENFGLEPVEFETLRSLGYLSKMRVLSFSVPPSSGGESLLVLSDRNKTPSTKIGRSVHKVVMVLLVAVFVFVSSSSSSGGLLNGGFDFNGGSCPKECQCYNLQVDCAERGLTTVPKGMPRNVEKM